MPADQHLQGLESRSWTLRVCKGCGEAALPPAPIECLANCEDMEAGAKVEVVPLDDSFIGLLRVVETIMDRHYPVDVFNAANPIVGNDPGTQLVVALRAVREAMTSG